MEEKEIVENNKLIAEFMGWNKYGNNVYHTPFENASYCNGEFTHIVNFPQDLKFNSSWDWLMPVVEKTLLIANELDDLEKFSIITDQVPYINEVYKAVVEFIKYYNGRKSINRS